MLVTTFGRWAKYSHYPRFGRERIARVVRIEHGNHGDGASAIAPRPLAVDERGLHISPVVGIAPHAAIRQGEVAADGVTVELAEKLDELFQIDAHLKGQLGERHLG